MAYFFTLKNGLFFHFKYFLGFESDLELAVRYEANAKNYLFAEKHNLQEIEDFLDNTKHIRKQIRLESCTELEEEFGKANEWFEKYSNYFSSHASGERNSEPSLLVAKALLELSDDLEIQIKEVN